MSERDPNLIKPRITTRETSLKNPSKREVLNGMMDDPKYDKMQEKHWKAIFAEWDLATETPGKRPSLRKGGARCGVSPNTIKYWKCRRDFAEASREVAWWVMGDWIPAMTIGALQDATSGKDKKMRAFFMERIFPTPEVKENAPDTEINITWGQGQPSPPDYVIEPAEESPDEDETIPDDPALN